MHWKSYFYKELLCDISSSVTWKERCYPSLSYDYAGEGNFITASWWINLPFLLTCHCALRGSQAPFCVQPPASHLADVSASGQELFLCSMFVQHLTQCGPGLKIEQQQGDRPALMPSLLHPQGTGWIGAHPLALGVALRPLGCERCREGRRNWKIPQPSL